MNITGKTEAVVEWLKTYDEIGDYLKLNATEMEAGERAINTVYNETVNREFINGVKEKVYTFALVLVCDWSEGSDSVNLEAQEFGEKWLDWIDGCMANECSPYFGENVTIQDIESLQNIPTLAAAYQDRQLARYMFQAAITYWEV